MSAGFTITRRNGHSYLVFVDADDLERVIAAGPWHMRPSRNTMYVQHTVLVERKRRTQKLHRFLLEAGLLEVDHVNGDGLDNRRSNLRLATHSENCRNQRRQSNNASGYKGVSWRADLGKWQARIGFDGKDSHLGYHATPELAHAAYCRAAAELHGEFARMG